MFLLNLKPWCNLRLLVHSWKWSLLFPHLTCPINFSKYFFSQEIPKFFFSFVSSFLILDFFYFFIFFKSFNSSTCWSILFYKFHSQNPQSPLLLCFLFLFFLCITLGEILLFISVLSKLWLQTEAAIFPLLGFWFSESKIKHPSIASGCSIILDFWVCPVWNLGFVFWFEIHKTCCFSFIFLQNSLLPESQESLRLFTCWVGVWKLQSPQFLSEISGSYKIYLDAQHLVLDVWDTCLQFFVKSSFLGVW